MAKQKTLHEKLTELTSNLWWSWQPEVGEIFRSIDPLRWSKLAHNPVILLQEFPPEKLERRAMEMGLNTRINWAYRRWVRYMESTDAWGARHAGVLGQRPAAYFSAEFGLHESLPIYSGGLGVLSGDHLKSASDLGVPLVGVGLFYDEGYFNQYIDDNGWQQESYTELNVDDLPVRPALDPEGKPVVISVATRGGDIHARVWRVDVGRVKLFLLDADIEQNKDEDRQLTARLYGGDQRTRIRQEIMLGIGGVRALEAIGIQPGMFHMNEGHSAFAGLEVIRRRITEDELGFDEALRETAAMCVFTTHTPVPAGHDRFDADLVEEHLGPLRDELGLSHDALLGLGRVEPQNMHESFCMTVLAFKLSRQANAVSSLHGVVSRRMWANLWPWRSEEEIPIGHITNGVHVPTWLAGQMRLLYDRVLPDHWYLNSGQPEVWADFESVSPGELWETHQLLKTRLIDYSRRKLVAQAERRKESPEQIEKMRASLDPQILTIGFARRFAPYKRSDLFMRDLDLLADLIGDEERPIQFIFAGKAHPADDNGKAIVQRIHQLSQDERFRGRVVLLENYDINLGRHLVQGVDVWLNNPRRPLEASGTSGQKVVLNGGLNCSILDGWWAEAYDGSNGFAIGTGRTHVNQEIQDQRDADSLMKVLTEEVVPLYYRRDVDDLPQEWIKRMKRAVRTLGWRFNADRMVMDYVLETYIGASGGLSCDMDLH
ncbi:alpha-glucan family phosphorylase [Symmachiella dynata]|uniref:Maltodextrin phosphorylase n=1 Tax=Symmachiella dynata TaxID=2527995 RepID=A0A517ZH73_9PLAN|nr:alpha-glucan family phosphorylase [Symmachiella dynata]QDT46327.1 Maltodextrin phosphorylase [Symmachiella dynata]QDU41833.1 Maltodextrin phosphorylase [Symmachiella dynata]